MKKIICCLVLFWATPAFAGKIVNETGRYSYTEIRGYIIGDCDAAVNNYQYENYSQPTQVQAIKGGTTCSLKVLVYTTRVRSGYDAKDNYVTEILSRKPANLARIRLEAEHESGSGSCNESRNCNILIASARTGTKGSTTIKFPWSNDALSYTVYGRKKGSSDTQNFYIKTLEGGE